MTREEALKRLEQNLSIMKFVDDVYVDCVDGEALEMAVKALHQPEQKKGKWVQNEDRAGWHCSCCGIDNYYAYSWNCETGKNDFQDKYCPNCGAKMCEEETTNEGS